MNLETTGIFCSDCIVSNLYWGTCTATLYSTPVFGSTQKDGAVWKLELSVRSTLCATSFWLSPTDCARVRSTFRKRAGVRIHLLNVNIRGARQETDLVGHLLCELIVPVQIAADKLHVNRRGNAEIQNLADDVCRLEEELRARKFRRRASGVARRCSARWASCGPVLVQLKFQHRRFRSCRCCCKTCSSCCKKARCCPKHLPVRWEGSPGG